MKTITTGFRIPSLREVCKKNDDERSSAATAAVQTLRVPYGVGKHTLQLTGIHVRLQPTGPSRGGSAKRGGASPFAAKAPPAVLTGAIAADIVVHAHVRGELNAAPQVFVVAVIPVRYDAAHNADGSAAAAATAGHDKEEKTGAASSSHGAATAAAAPYDKRVLNAQAREARRGVVAPMPPSNFAKVDLRVQMERVRLSFTVVPVGRLSTGVVHRGKRSREEGEREEEGEKEAEKTLVDCMVDVTVVGTVSPIA